MLIKLLKNSFSTLTNQKRPLYLDMQATTPIDFRVLDAMLPYLTIDYGNPHSKTHLYGINADKIIEKSRLQVACLLNAEQDEIIFNSGASESNNAALLGLSQYHFENNTGKNHIITIKTEHKTVLEACKYIEKKYNFKVDYLDVDSNGLISLENLEQKINQYTLVVSVMSLNNEIGVLQDLQKIGLLCEQKNAIFHTDSAQAIGKIDLDKKLNLLPIIHGGGQEKGLRSGTLSPPMVAALGEACSAAQREMQNDNKYIKKLYDRMFRRIFSKIDDVKLNGDPQQRYFGNLNVSFKDVLSSSIMDIIKNSVALSAGAACSDEPSYVLSAIKVPEEYAFGSIRIGVGRFTTFEEVDFLVDILIESVKQCRQNN
ncbi:nfs1 nitrogen fixation protein 1, putative [Ichthyophthirius multifiliis]|uniref:Nfs1 nitrogen fixation protein 1, putative n=1 Tax=Ichthyophthirius multifiliis TaxID=5932 RepID=G0QNW5_ICHMU|nr:nfs1 nitrogen fixation protein 1, putative [Ichthyophthirius multifiliis]EGR33093.1 nfs1 nitrogen fixation protein 1, putative [Ichthyophthirius multifiliis]|eukprot:XP_004037079.1 nfs1 nitrogen fixation protein 1, putative [Ichthyophthirius multifiliis]